MRKDDREGEWADLFGLTEGGELSNRLQESPGKQYDYAYNTWWVLGAT